MRVINKHNSNLTIVCYGSKNQNGIVGIYRKKFCMMEWKSSNKGVQNICAHTLNHSDYITGLEHLKNPFTHKVPKVKCL